MTAILTIMRETDDRVQVAEAMGERWYTYAYGCLDAGAWVHGEGLDALARGDEAEADRCARQAVTLHNAYTTACRVAGMWEAEWGRALADMHRREAEARKAAA